MPQSKTPDSKKHGLSWKEAIIKALEMNGEPMHYSRISDVIAKEGWRKKLGSNPASSVASTISQSLTSEGENTPFVKISKSMFSLKNAGRTSVTQSTSVTSEEQGDTGFINAFGMYWKRDYVHWANKAPKILGQQQVNSKEVNFSNQKGVYLLHDGNKVVYVGRTTDQTLGVRLKQHTIDRLNGRWDRFSWFGIYAVKENGELSKDPDNFNIENLIATMEALLIEGLEPPQNRRRGDDFSAVEFLQKEDPDIVKKRDEEAIQRRLSVK